MLQITFCYSERQNWFDLSVYPHWNLFVIQAAQDLLPSHLHISIESMRQEMMLIVPQHTGKLYFIERKIQHKNQIWKPMSIKDCITGFHVVLFSFIKMNYVHCKEMANIRETNVNMFPLNLLRSLFINSLYFLLLKCLLLPLCSVW